MTDIDRVVSPIHVAHRLIAEVFFSVYGEMDNGEKMPSPGPGGLRVMRITRAVAVPSVSFPFERRPRMSTEFTLTTVAVPTHFPGPQFTNLPTYFLRDNRQSCRLVQVMWIMAPRNPLPKMSTNCHPSPQTRSRPNDDREQNWSMSTMCWEKLRSRWRSYLEHLCVWIGY